jgi:hypothetical protein
LLSCTMGLRSCSARNKASAACRRSASDNMVELLNVFPGMVRLRGRYLIGGRGKIVSPGSITYL